MRPNTGTPEQATHNIYTPSPDASQSPALLCTDQAPSTNLMMLLWCKICGMCCDSGFILNRESAKRWHGLVSVLFSSSSPLSGSAYLFLTSIVRKLQIHSSAILIFCGCFLFFFAQLNWESLFLMEVKKWMYFLTFLYLFKAYDY